MTEFPKPPWAGRTTTVFSGSVIEVRIENVHYADGHVEQLEILRHRGAAAALPVLAPEERPDGGTGTGVLLLRQYRHSVGDWIWELPAGKIDGGEPAAVCAARELREEAGVVAGRLDHLTTLLTTPGFTDERIDLFLATEVRIEDAEPEPHELIVTAILDLEEALSMVESGEISDAKTVVALLLGARKV